MNAVEYCLLHGLKLAGPEHPAILCAQESLSYGALAARVSQYQACAMLAFVPVIAWAC